MKKLLKGIIAFFCVATIAFSMVACNDEVENGSKIQTCKITFSYTDADNNAVSRDVSFKLYLNFAPATIEHFRYLAENGYYNNVAVSNVDSYVEFGEFYYDGDLLKSKYAEGLDKGYYSLITKDYSLNKYLGSSKNLARYADNLSINGEFAENGIGGNKLTLSSGALVLKRDPANDESSCYNTGKGSMAITFGTSTYFNSSDKYAIIGKIVMDDGENFDDEKSSYDFIRDIMSDYKADPDGNSYWYYSYADTEYAEQLETLGRYFMKDDGAYYVKGADGKYDKEVDTEDYEDLLEEMSDNSNYLINLPYTKITITAVTFG